MYIKLSTLWVLLKASCYSEVNNIKSCMVA